MTERTAIVFTTPFRRRARAVERQLQEALEAVDDGGAPSVDQRYLDLLQEYGVPGWAHGVRVEHAGPFSYAVVATVAQGR